MRPRVLYFTTFLWLVLIGGRFRAPFLHTLLHFNESLIGIAIGLQIILGSVFGSILAVVADGLERRFPMKGRIGFLCGSVVVATLAFGMHQVILGWYPPSHYYDTYDSDTDTNEGDIGYSGEIDNTNTGHNGNENENDSSSGNDNDNQNMATILHLTAIILYSISLSAFSPVLDGITLSYLQQQNLQDSDYGKERLYGAIAWSIASIVVGPLVDVFGYHVFFMLAPIGAGIVCVSSFLYARDSCECECVSPSFNSSISTSPRKNDDGVEYDGLEQVMSTDTEWTNGSASVSSVSASASIVSSQEDSDQDVSFDEEYERISQDAVAIQPLEVEMNRHLDTNTKTMNNDGSNNGSLNNEEQSPSQDKLHFQSICKLMCGNILAIGFLISAITLNMGTSVVENLIFLFFQELGGSNTICGITVLVTVLFEIPIFHYAPKLLSRYGAELLQKVACVAYIVRVVGYTLVPKEHVVLVLFLEPMHGVTYACSKTASVEFAAMLSTKGYEATYQGILSMILGLGSFVGLFCGGYIEDSLGSIFLYRSYAGIVGLGLLVFVMTTRWKRSDGTKNSLLTLSKARRKDMLKRNGPMYDRIDEEMMNLDELESEPKSIII